MTEHVNSVRSVAIGVWVGIGSRSEAEDQAGITHFLEHLLFKGTEHRTAREIAEQIESVGGQLYAFTGKEYTCFYVRILDEYMITGLELLADMLLASRFDEDDIEREKGVIIEEIRMYEDTPEDLVHDLFNATIWHGHPLGRSVLGSEQTVQTFSRSDLQRFFANHYTADNIVIAAAGNLVHDELVQIVSDVFSALPTGGKTAIGSPAQAGSRLAVITRAIEQAHICLGVTGLGHDDQDIYHLQVLNNLLGGGSSSRLFQGIREDRGLAYSVYSYLQSCRDCGLLTVYAGMNPGNVKAVVDLVRTELANIKQDGITTEEHERAVAQLKATLMMNLENTGARMSRLGRMELLMGKVIPPAEVIQKLSATTPEGVQKLAKRLFAKPPTIALVGPELAADGHWYLQTVVGTGEKNGIDGAH